MISGEKLFHRYINVGPADGEHVIFKTQVVRSGFGTTTEIYLDGTFKCVPNLFANYSLCIL